VFHVITDEGWREAMIEIESLRAQMVSGTLLPAERERVRKKLSGRLFRLGYLIKPMGEA